MKMRTLRVFTTIAALGFVLSVAQAADTPDATLKLSGGSMAAGVGVSWGSGTLTYKGKTYPISVTGLSIGEVGATKLEASGEVYHLNMLDDFDGNYTAAGAAATLAGGAGAVAMRNQNGVTVSLVSTTRGLKVALGAGGVSMRIKK